MSNMPELDIEPLSIEAIERLIITRVQPGDLLVVHAKDGLPHAAYEHMQIAWDNLGEQAGIKVIVVNSVDGFSVIRPEAKPVASAASVVVHDAEMLRAAYLIYRQGCWDSGNTCHDFTEWYRRKYGDGDAE